VAKLKKNTPTLEPEDPRMVTPVKSLPHYAGPKGNLGKWDTGQVAGKSSSSPIIPSPSSVTTRKWFGSNATSEMG
jgi:hypothetical protein